MERSQARALGGQRSYSWQPNPRDKSRIFHHKSRISSRNQGPRKFLRIRISQKKRPRLCSFRELPHQRDLSHQHVWLLPPWAHCWLRRMLLRAKLGMDQCLPAPLQALCPPAAIRARMSRCIPSLWVLRPRCSAHGLRTGQSLHCEERRAEQPARGEIRRSRRCPPSLRRAGRGRAAGFLHGNGSMIQDFSSSGLLDKAARKYRVIVFDRPGFGYSKRPRLTDLDAEAQADLIRKALDRLGFRKQPCLAIHGERQWQLRLR